MKVRPTLLSALILASACTKSPAGSSNAPAIVDHEVVIELGRRAVLTQDIGVTFSRLVEDSRCPANAVCVWMGNARVELRFDGEASADSLNTNGQSGPRTLTHKYLSVEMVNVEPYPGTGVQAPTTVRLRWSYLPD